MVNFYDIESSKLSSKDVEPGSLYFCRDNGEIYLDSFYTNTRYKFGGSSSDNDTTSIKVTINPLDSNTNMPFTSDGYISNPGIYVCGTTSIDGTNVFYVDSDKKIYEIFRGKTYNSCVLFENEVSIPANTTISFIPDNTMDGFDKTLSSIVSKVEFIPDASFEDLAEITMVSANNCTVKTGNFTVYGKIRVWGNSIIHIDTSYNH